MFGARRAIDLGLHNSTLSLDGAASRAASFSSRGDAFLCVPRIRGTARAEARGSGCFANWQPDPERYVFPETAI